MIERIRLYQFRNYLQTDFNFCEAQTVLWGANGAGKTNILEALSLFAVGQGLRHAHFSDMICSQCEMDKAWALHLRLNQDLSFSTGLSVTGQMRRLCKIQGTGVKSAASFHEYMNVISLTPIMDHLFIESANQRRDFVDRCITSYNPMHSLHLNAYEKAMRQRLNLLKKGPPLNPAWLISLEQIMTKNAFLISQARHQFVQILQEGQNIYLPLFPKFTSMIAGNAENILEDQYVDQLKLNREKDGLVGMTTFGCHRSDWVVTHMKNQRLVKDCSTGEQKIILISVILSFVNFRRKNYDGLLVLLLDDIVAKLDVSHRQILFEQIQEFNQDLDQQSRVQVFLTGTDLESFQGLQNAQFLHISPCSFENGM